MILVLHFHFFRIPCNVDNEEAAFPIFSDDTLELHPSTHHPLLFLHTFQSFIMELICSPRPKTAECPPLPA